MRRMIGTSDLISLSTSSNSSDPVTGATGPLPHLFRPLPNIYLCSPSIPCFAILGPYIYMYCHIRNTKTTRPNHSKSSSPTCRLTETTSMFDPATAASPTLPTVVRQAVKPDRKEQSHASIVVTHVSMTTVWPCSQSLCRARKLASHLGFQSFLL